MIREARNTASGHSTCPACRMEELYEIYRMVWVYQVKYMKVKGV
jgi:hypothetical protein